jgi:hypothetical protein
VAHVYRFNARWQLPADPDVVYAILSDVPGYPRWWPQVLRGTELADGVGEIRVRSALPYELTLRLAREVEDPAGRRLRARMEGDLIGWSEWTVRPVGNGCEVDFREQARLGKRGLNRLPALVRPILIANHSYMMRGGERGLRAYLEA